MARLYSTWHRHGSGIKQPTTHNKSCNDHFNAKYTPSFLNEFLTPFFRGVFLDQPKKQCQQFQYYLHCFFRKGAAVPKNGMKEIPNQCLKQLNPTSIELNTSVNKVESNALWINNKKHTFKHIVIATDISTCHALLNKPLQKMPWNGISNYIFEKKNQHNTLPVNTYWKRVLHFTL